MRNVVTVPADKLRAMQERIAELEASVEEHRNIAVSEMKLNEKLEAEIERLREIMKTKLMYKKRDTFGDSLFYPTDKWIDDALGGE